MSDKCRCGVDASRTFEFIHKLESELEKPKPSMVAVSNSLRALRINLNRMGLSCGLDLKEEDKKISEILSAIVDADYPRAKELVEELDKSTFSKLYACSKK